MEWIHFPRIRTFVEKRFHGLFSKKKRSKSGGDPSFESFPRREHSSGSNFPPDWAANSSRSISRHYWMTCNFSRITARETCSRTVISLQKNLSRKISRFFVSKISPATGVSDCTVGRSSLVFADNWLCCNWNKTLSSLPLCNGPAVTTESIACLGKMRDKELPTASSLSVPRGI